MSGLSVQMLIRTYVWIVCANVNTYVCLDCLCKCSHRRHMTVAPSVLLQVDINQLKYSIYSVWLYVLCSTY